MVKYTYGVDQIDTQVNYKEGETLFLIQDDVTWPPIAPSIQLE